MSLEANTQLLGQKLADIDARIQTKSAFSDKYRETIMNALSKISDKIRTLLQKQNAALKDIKRKGSEKMGDLSKKLVKMRDDEKKKGTDAMNAAKAEQQELANRLNGASKQIDIIKAELKKPDPNLQILQQTIDVLKNDVKDAKTAQTDAENALDAAKKDMAARDKAIDESSRVLEDALRVMDDLIDKVDKMHITQEDLDEAVKKLHELEKLLESSGDDDDTPDISDLFIQDEIPSLGTNPEREETINVETMPSSSLDIEPEMADLGPSPTIESESMSVRNDPTPQEAYAEPFLRPSSVPSKGALIGKKQNAAQGKKALSDIMAAANVKGGKTKRRRRHITLKKGGYVIKKNTTRDRKKIKNRKTRSTSSSSKKSTRKTDRASK